MDPWVRLSWTLRKRNIVISMKPIPYEFCMWLSWKEEKFKDNLIYVLRLYLSMNWDIPNFATNNKLSNYSNKTKKIILIQIYERFLLFYKGWTCVYF